VISVGNLTVGGNGKTPAVLALARAALDAGTRPAILTRGYRGRREGTLRVGAWEDGAPAAAAESGDEPLLLSRRLPEVPVVVGRDRQRGALSLLERNPGVDLFLLDDGFQHRGLFRDRDLVLLDARSPVGNGHLLPAGPLREPARALARAHHLILVVDGPGAGVPEKTAQLLDRVAPRVPRSRAWTAPAGFHPLRGDATWNDAASRGAVAVAGIARPERFASLLASLGVTVDAWRPFPDHHPFSAEEVAALEREAASRQAPLVTTAKDAVRLEGLTAPDAPWWVLEIALASERPWPVWIAEAGCEPRPGRVS
jgi:tetraacyldisaccharide 4'-kinase